ncbi:MAG: sulfite exporter TauE/SafE family protein [Chloroflexi bacterium]|nr:sulfite exporter TauE/SafE family protein [Chloroflexota bacterium]
MSASRPPSQRTPAPGAATSAAGQPAATRTVPIAGMTCRACERRIEREILQIPNVVSVSASAPLGRAEVTTAGPVDDASLAAAVAAAGYEVGRTPWLSHDRAAWVSAGIAVVAVAAAVLLAEVLGLTRLASGTGEISEGGLVVAGLLGLAAGFSTCMALTGGFVLALSAAHEAARPAGAVVGIVERLRPTVMFVCGRIIGFSVFGALLGAVGSLFVLPTTVVAALMIAVALLMTLIGTRLTGLSPRLAAWSPTLPAGLARGLGMDAGSVSAYSDGRAAVLGGLTFFLPCGFTQAVQVYALSTGSPVMAGAIMAVFAIGTAPGLLALGGLPALLPARVRPGLLRVVGVVVLGFAIVNLSAGLRLAGVSPSILGAPAPTVAGSAATDDGVQVLRTRQTLEGYLPQDVAITAGVPTRWVIDSEDPQTCAVFLRVPSLGIAVTLKKGENVIDLPALEPGRIDYMCSMGMYGGTLTVLPPTEG